MIVVGSVPVVVCGLLLKDLIKGTLYDTPVIGAAAIVFALLLLESEAIARHRPGRDESHITWRDAI